MAEVETIGSVNLAGGAQFVVVRHDLLAEPVDAIVNAANGGLAHGGGVAAAIARAAGPALEDECERIIASQGRIATGDAVVTTAGNLPYKGVIHVVGPRQGDGDEEAKIAAAIGRALALAAERGWASLSFPAVSAGIFGVPPKTCARGYLRAVKDFFGARPDASLRTVRLVLTDEKLIELFRALLARREA